VIIPCIDLMDGKVVQLVQGREKALEGGSPLEMLEKFRGVPADSGDRSGCGHGPRVERRAGGTGRFARQSRAWAAAFDRPERARALIEQGAYRVIVGTAAFDREKLLQKSPMPWARTG
jgi:phosphoribosylformimino-5-aminoimidazole carboxamide ribotide isomerase